MMNKIFFAFLGALFLLIPISMTKGASAGKTVTLPENQVVFKEGQKADGFYYIEKGQVAVVKTVGGKERVIAKLGAGEIFGEMALIDKKPRSATIKTLRKTKLVFVSSKEFNKQLSTLDPWAASLIQTLSKRLRTTTDELAAKNSPRSKLRAMRTASKKS
ncbi:cyclic nucleotide-binding domain-containing protein [Oscillatoria laete-virens NRMC-F 0139]|nr:cyclic nucleotide-binding domain-containing protein [Oscillatoria laete-virens]MDL5053917.1 cyclic nucleotide-binding domain-containing protein [Oscillatoria laete-virens NRMC-F 0139]